MCEAVVVVDSVSNLPITVNQTRVICSLEDWKRMDRQEAVKKQCEKTFNDFFIELEAESNRDQKKKDQRLRP